MDTISKTIRSNDTIYWLYAKSKYSTQKYVDKVFEANQIIDNLWLGGIPSAVCDRESLQKRNIELVILAVYGSIAMYPFDFKYLRSNLKDVDDEDILHEIKRLIPEIHKYITNNKGVLVSCVKGRSRSSSVVIAYLIKYKDMTIEEAIYFIINKRSQIKPNDGYMKQLKIFEEEVKKDKYKDQ